MSEVAILHALLVEQARQVRRAASPEQWAAMKATRRGDYVLEVSSWRPHEDRQDVGRLICVKPDPESGNGATVTYIEALDGTLVRWRNAEFVRLFPGWLSSAANWADEAKRRHGVDGDLT